ncbi:MAG: hypothetical protein GX591_13720, partial [Planctomycetes bacterium]|nr:hypothetical protein [Planctomycetota bacterium]
TMSKAQAGPWYASVHSATAERLTARAEVRERFIFDGSLDGRSEIGRSITFEHDGAARVLLLHAGLDDLDLRLTDPAGNRIGYDAAVGADLIEIAGAAYTGSDVRYQIIDLPAVQAGQTWHVTIAVNDASEGSRAVLAVHEIPDRPAELAALVGHGEIHANVLGVATVFEVRELGGARSVDGLELTCSELRAADGTVLPIASMHLAFAGDATAVAAGRTLEAAIDIVMDDAAVDGVYTGTITIGGADAVSGAALSDTIEFVLVLDRASPAVPTLTMEPDADDPARMVFAGVAEPGCAVEILLDGRLLDRSFADAGGLYRTQPYLLPAGSHNLVARAIDSAGNVSDPTDPTTVATAEDRRGPTVRAAWDGLRDSAGTFRGEAVLSLTGDDGGGAGLDVLLYSLDGGATWQPYTGELTFETVGIHAVHYCGVDLAGNASLVYLTAAAIGEGLPAPAVTDVAVDDATGQRSMVRSLSISFDQPVVLDAAALLLIHAADGPVDLQVSDPAGDGIRYVVTFADPSLSGPSLRDGWYRLVVFAGGVANDAGQPMAAEYSTDFHRLFADADGDRDVDWDDFIGVRRAYGSAIGQAAYRDIYDVNADGVIDMTDVLAAGSRIGVSLPDPTFQPPVMPGVVVNDGSVQRSMIRSLTVTLAAPADLTAASLHLRRSDGTLVDVDVANPAGDRRTYVLTFAGAATEYGSLADGDYTLTVAGGAVGGSDLVFSFHRHFGDADGDRDVDLDDFSRLVGTFGRTSADPLFNDALDADSDGDVDLDDFVHLRRRFGRPVP